MLALGAALLPRLALFSVNENLYGDAVVRTELAVRWVTQPHWLGSFHDGAYQFGPLHLYLVGLAHLVWPVAEHSGRLVSLGAGVLAVVPLFALTRRWFDQTSAWFAVLALASWSLHLQLSTTAASEALGIVLFLCVVERFDSAWRKGGVGALLASAVALDLLMATRYDAWLLGPLLVALLALRPTVWSQRAKAMALFGLTCSVFPVVWLVGNAADGPDALYPMRYIQTFHERWYADGVAVWGALAYRLQNLFFWPGAAVVTLGPLVGAAGMIGLVRAWRLRRDLRWAVLVVLVPTLYFALRGAVLADFVPLARFTVLQLVLLLPFVGFGLPVLLPWTGSARRRAALVAGTSVLWVVALGTLCTTSSSRFARALSPVSPVSRNPPGVRMLAQRLRAVEAGSVVAIDAHARDLDLQVAFFSNLDEQRLVRYRWEGFWNRFEELSPRYLVRFVGGSLEKDRGVVLVPNGLTAGGRSFVRVVRFPEGLELLEAL